jgi:hypothetical protein
MPNLGCKFKEAKAVKQPLTCLDSWTLIIIVNFNYSFKNK